MIQKQTEIKMVLAPRKAKLIHYCDQCKTETNKCNNCLRPFESCEPIWCINQTHLCRQCEQKGITIR